METIQDLLAILKYSKSNAATAAKLYEISDKKVSLDHFKRQLRSLSAEARKLGHRVIGDDSGYYMAMNEKEWQDYSRRRFSAIKDELVSLAGPEGISVQDLIKLVYKVKVDDPNFNLAL